MALSNQSTRKTRRDADADFEAEDVIVRNDVDCVAQVSRTAAGEPHQNAGYELIGLPEDATDEERAAAENLPVDGKGSKPSKSDSSTGGSKGSSSSSSSGGSKNATQKSDSSSAGSKSGESSPKADSTKDGKD